MSAADFTPEAPVGASTAYPDNTVDRIVTIEVDDEVRTFSGYRDSLIAKQST